MPIDFQPPDAHPAPVDWSLRVRTRPVAGGLVLDYELTSPSGTLDLQTVEAKSERLNVEDLKREHVRLLSGLEGLLRRLGEAEEPLLNEEIEEELRLRGQDLYLRLFPDPLKDFYRQYRDKIASLLVVSDEPWIPWELVHPDESEDDDFLCLRFPMARWLAGQYGPAQGLRVERLLCAEAAAVEGYPTLRSAQEEREWLEKLKKEIPGLEGNVLVAARHADFTTRLKRGGFDLIHFAGHADHDPADLDHSRLVLTDRTLWTSHLAGEILRQIAKDRPLVFLNACRVARVGLALTGVGGWPDRWVRRGRCGALLCPQWVVRDATAFLFTKTFYSRLGEGATLGEAVLDARRKLREADPTDPTYLAYSLYAHPNAVVGFGAKAVEVPAERRTTPIERYPLKELSESQRLTPLLAWYLPEAKAFSRVYRSLGFPFWQLSLRWTPTERWQEVVASCEATGRLAELRRAACEGIPAAAARRLRNPLAETMIPDSSSGRRETIQRLRSALPRSLVAGPQKSNWRAEELLGHWSLWRFATADSSSVPPRGEQDRLLELVLGSDVDAALGDPLHSEWIRQCWRHMDPDLELPLAALALVGLCAENPSHGKAAMHWTLEHLDRMSALRLDLAGWWLRWWPDGVVVADSWLRKAVDQTPAPDDLYRALARLSRLERLLIDVGAAPWKQSEDAPSLGWATRAGLVGQLAPLLENLGEERQSVYLKFFSAGREAHVPLARSLRRLAQIQGGFEVLPPEPWATALRCSLPAATADELRDLARDDKRLDLWLSVLPLTLSEPQLDVLSEVFQHRPSPRRQRLAQAAGACLAAHPDPQAVWSRLRSAGRPWIRLWAKERTADDPVEAWLAQLAGLLDTDPEMDLVRQAWQEVHGTARPNRSDRHHVPFGQKSHSRGRSGAG